MNLLLLNFKEGRKSTAPFLDPGSRVPSRPLALFLLPPLELLIRSWFGLLPRGTWGRCRGQGGTGSGTSPLTLLTSVRTPFLWIYSLPLKTRLWEGKLPAVARTVEGPSLLRAGTRKTAPGGRRRFPSASIPGAGTRLTAPGRRRRIFPSVWRLHPGRSKSSPRAYL